ncbi:MAG: NAD(P) transhydrogenase subunit alpha [Nocardiopsaceae bacterium]|nr:NAD(P) transhydrogenase subunit alpha [Nocardiopsaceae bacterium]
MFLANVAICVLAGFVGFTVISKVPNTLHTPLMSGTNAIHGIVLLGGLVLASGASGAGGSGGADLGALDQLLLGVAIAFGVINVVGGFCVTDRMLGMFKGNTAKGGPAKGDAARGNTANGNTANGDTAKAREEKEGAGRG